MAQRLDPFAYQCVIFDFDYTLIKLDVDWRAWEVQILDLIRRYQTNSQVTSISHYQIHHYVTQYGAKFLQDFKTVSSQAENANLHGYQPMTQSIVLLQQLQQASKQLFLLTSNSRNTTLPILTKLNLANYFSKIITLDEVANLKPTAAAFELIKEDNVPLNKYLMVGDSESDSGFAKNADIAYLDVRDI